MRTFIASAVVITAALLLAGCSGQRALHIVRADADRAYEREQYQTALADYSEVVERAPSDWEYRLKYAQTLMTVGEYTLAQEHAGVVANLRPHDDEVVALFADAMFASDDHDRLITYLQRRAEDRREVRDYLRLGWFAIEVGDADLARRALTTAARLDAGRTVEPQLALADFYAAAGDDDRALHHLRIALGIDTTNETVKRRIRAYGEIPGPSFALHPDRDP